MNVVQSIFIFLIQMDSEIHLFSKFIYVKDFYVALVCVDIGIRIENDKVYRFSASEYE